MGASRVFFNLVVDEPSTERVFFERLLGMEPRFESDWFVHLVIPDKAELELGILSSKSEVVPAEVRPTVGGGLMTFVVDDVDALVAKAKAEGYPVVEEPQNLFYGQRRALLRTPSGALVDVSSECAPDESWLARVEPGPGGGYRER